MPKNIFLLRLDVADHGTGAGWADRRPNHRLPPSAGTPIAGAKRDLRRLANNGN